MIAPSKEVLAWVEHYRRDNPFPVSLREHAAFWRDVAFGRHRRNYPRDVRVDAARRAMGCLLAARAVEVKQ